jgi:hypothetical protein
MQVSRKASSAPVGMRRDHESRIGGSSRSHLARASPGSPKYGRKPKLAGTTGPPWPAIVVSRVYPSGRSAAADFGLRAAASRRHGGAVRRRAYRGPAEDDLEIARDQGARD